MASMIDDKVGWVYKVDVLVAAVDNVVSLGSPPQYEFPICEINNKYRYQNNSIRAPTTSMPLTLHCANS